VPIFIGYGARISHHQAPGRGAEPLAVRQPSSDKRSNSRNRGSPQYAVQWKDRMMPPQDTIT
jgi:hypothetical protein